MHLKSEFLLLTIALSLSLVVAYQSGKGKFVSLNGNRYTEAKSLDEDDNKTLNVNRNRPPAHDTPASRCSCSKFHFEAEKKNLQSTFRMKK